MTSSPLRRAVRVLHGARSRLSRSLALTAVALPLVALAPAPAGVVGPASAREPVVAPVRQVVTVIDGSAVQRTITLAPTVLDVLQELEVQRGPLDRVVPDLLAPIDGPTSITITRAELVEDEAHVELPRAVVRIDDPQMLRGYARVVQRGSTGVRVDTRLTLLVDGEKESVLTVASEVVRAPQDRIVRVGTRMLAEETVWDALARCEAGGRWDAVRYSGDRVLFSGGLQFTPRTWNAFRPDGFPELAADATREQQIEVAERVLDRQGWGAWPSCSSRLGLR